METLGFNNLVTPFVILEAKRIGGGVVKKVCYDMETVIFESGNYERQEGAFVNTQGLRVANDYDTYALVAAAHVIVKEILEVVA
ncbi:hypothetical protein [Kurthia senegalensis]|uniref:hypothetical protein n=1 Tax=Kurthia senegalensis TaxID=1033740 RepID=UPI00028A1118|nr:hypothetical protein [Kurthia senegalensis]